MPRKPDIAIIGPGKVGATLGILAARAGYRVVGVAGRDAGRTAQAARGIGADVRTGTPAQIAALGQLVVLTVPDDAIGTVCRELAQAKAFAPGAMVVHCSGAIGSDILAPARDRCSAGIASMHPLQTFPNVAAGVEKFPGTYCFCEGDAPVLEVLEELARALGGKPVRMSSAGKLLYHASAVLACNYFIGLVDAALATAGHAGIAPADAQAALEPLIRTTVENIFTLGPAKALTGPIARGDANLVARQFADVQKADPALGDIYRTLGLWTINLAVRKGTIDPAKAEELRTTLAP